MVGEDLRLESIDVSGEECRIDLGKAVHELFGEVALPVGRAPRPGQGSAHLVGGMRDRAVEPVDGAVVEGGLRPADLGDHPEQSGCLVIRLTGLRDQQRQQVIVGHAAASIRARAAASCGPGGTSARAATLSTTAMSRTYIRAPTVSDRAASDVRASGTH